jgi:hypothetical protein
MRTRAVSLDDLAGVFAVPPLARTHDPARSLDHAQNTRLARHIVAGGITRLVYAAADPKAGACGSVLSVMNHPQLNHKVEVVTGLLADECGSLLTNFFRARRTKLPSPDLASE